MAIGIQTTDNFLPKKEATANIDTNTIHFNLLLPLIPSFITNFQTSSQTHNNSYTNSIINTQRQEYLSNNGF